MIVVREIKDVECEGLGKKIREARKRLRGKKSVEQICEELGVSRTYYYDIENECIRGTLSIENLRRIEKTLNIDLGVNFKQPIAA